MVQKTCQTVDIKIYIAGCVQVAKQRCRGFCLDGFCVSVTETEFVYTFGAEKGVVIGIINYPRFPETPDSLFEKAVQLAHVLRTDLLQSSFTVTSSHHETLYYSVREDSK